MDETLGRERAKRPLPEEFPPLSPEGYTLEVLLMLRQIDLLKELMRVIPASFSGKLPPPFPAEPRPQTAEQRFRDQQETEEVLSALHQMGLKRV